VKRQDAEWDLSCPHAREMIRYLIAAFFVDAASFELKDRVLGNQSPTSVSVDTVDLWGWCFGFLGGVVSARCSAARLLQQPLLAPPRPQGSHPPQIAPGVSDRQIGTRRCADARRTLRCPFASACTGQERHDLTLIKS
jgi:hypothetical protein